MRCRPWYRLMDCSRLALVQRDPICPSGWRDGAAVVCRQCSRGSPTGVPVRHWWFVVSGVVQRGCRCRPCSIMCAVTVSRDSCDYVRPVPPQATVCRPEQGRMSSVQVPQLGCAGIAKFLNGGQGRAQSSRQLRMPATHNQEVRHGIHDTRADRGSGVPAVLWDDEFRRHCGCRHVGPDVQPLSGHRHQLLRLCQHLCRRSLRGDSGGTHQAGARRDCPDDQGLLARVRSAQRQGVVPSPHPHAGGEFPAAAGHRPH